jgi:cyclophilin family peptidyl-prolyl cis-trans isomerase
MKKILRIMAAVAAVLLAAVVVCYLYDTFRERTQTEKLAEIIHLEDRRLLSNHLKKYLQDESPIVRSRAALTVGRIGGEGSGGLLFPLLTDTVLEVAATAAFALGLTGEQQYAAKLLDTAFNLPSSVGAKAVEAAGRLADSSMTDIADRLVDYLSHPSPDVREAACMALFRAGAKAKGRDLLKAIKSEPDELVRKAALYALARLQVREAAPVFIEYLADPDPFARSLAVRGLGAVPTTQEVEHYLSIALNDADRGVVAEAINQLAAKKSRQARTLLAKRLEREKDEKLVVTLLEALRRQKNDRGIDATLSILATQPPPYITAAVVKYVATIRKDRAVNLIDSLATEGEPYVKAACAEALGMVGDKKVVSRLAMLFNDEDPMVRAAAFEEVVKLDTTNRDLYIKRALADEDYVVVVHAVELIKKKRLSRYLPVMNMLMSRGAEIDVDIRRSLVETARVFLEANKDDTLALGILYSGLLDPEYIVRREAAATADKLLEEKKPAAWSQPETRITEDEIAEALNKFQTNPRATIVTSKGELEVELLFDVAPLTVLNFIALADDGFYNGLTFHRVVPNFVVQGGDPRGDGWGGPGYFIRCEYSDEPFERGTVGVATSGKDTGGSQFFITLSPQPHLEGRYTVFGRVTEGMDVVEQIVVGDLIETILIHE